MPERVVIIGGGVGGLTAALAFGRAGHPVTVLERDPLPPTADAEEAFVAERRGAPQVHQTHGFLARLQVTLRERFPDVLADLLAAGGSTLPMTRHLGPAQPGDEDLQVIIVRRTTLEWVLRKAVLAQPHVEVRTGVAVAGLVAGAPAADGTPVVSRGAPRRRHHRRRQTSSSRRPDDGATCPGGWASSACDVPETIHESGLMYLTRWYRTPDVDVPIDAKLGGDLGFVKFLGIPGDGGTLSITLAVRTDDGELRAGVVGPGPVRPRLPAPARSGHLLPGRADGADRRGAAR